MIGGPHDIDSDTARAFRETAEAGEKIDGFQSTVMAMQTKPLVRPS
jgi:hypothetical protein